MATSPDPKTQPHDRRILCLNVRRNCWQNDAAIDPHRSRLNLFRVVAVLLLVFNSNLAFSQDSPESSTAENSTTDNSTSENSTAAEIFEIHGVIQTASGQPIPRATVHVVGPNFAATTDDNGQLNFKLDTSAPVQILTTASDKNIGFLTLDPTRSTKFTLQLKDHSPPVTGRIIDHQGQGVRDANLDIEKLNFESSIISLPAGLKQTFATKTDASGTFQIHGIPRESLGQITVSAEGIVRQTINRANFENEIVMVAQPARTITGKSLDRHTQKPVSNVTVSAGGQTATTDVDGNFELKGLPAFQPITLSATETGEQPYLFTQQTVQPETGFKPRKIELTLEPGLWINSTVKDFGTNGPASAEVYYYPLPANKKFESYFQPLQFFGALRPGKPTDQKGMARTVGLDGPGIVAVTAEGFPAGPTLSKLSDEQRTMLFQSTGRNDWAAIQLIEPKDLGQQINLDFLISKGRSIDIVIAQEQIAPTDPLVLYRSESKTSGAQNVKGSKFQAQQLQPGEKRAILIHAPQKQMGAVLNIKGEAESPVKISLKPTGALSGRIMDKEQTPQAGLMMTFQLTSEPTEEADQQQPLEIAAPVFTDANGFFETPSLVAGLKYQVSAIRLSATTNMMMKGTPKVDSRWEIAKALEINSNESVDLGTIVLDSEENPEPKREQRTEVAKTDNSLPAIINGMVTDESGQPLANAMISFNTWPNRTGDPAKDLELTPTVLAQSKSNDNGQFQMTIDPSLEDKMVATDSGNNGAIVVWAKKYGSKQIPIQDIQSAQSLAIKLNREMVVRGKIVGDIPTGFALGPAPKIQVYDADSIQQIMAQLKSGKSLDQVQPAFKPTATLDPLVGGIPTKWMVSSSGSFLVQNIPFNSIFTLQACSETGQPKTITVISRPVREFEIKRTSDSTEMHSAQGSRIRIDMNQVEAKK